MLYIQNRATNSHPGSGLPFYNSLDKIFSALNPEFNSTDGLWRVPANKLPTFQLWVFFASSTPVPTITTFRYKETRGNNDFTGVTFTPPSGANIKPSKKDGTQYFVIYTKDDGTMITPAPKSRWVIELTITQGVTSQTFYSEEFVTFDCCE